MKYVITATITFELDDELPTRLSADVVEAILTNERQRVALDLGVDDYFREAHISGVSSRRDT